MFKQSKVSVVIPLFNRADLIQETVSSITDQTSPNWELIVVDDGSTDGADKIVQKCAEQDSRVKLYVRDRLPKGAPTCRNIGVEKSTGDYIIFLDSDDLLAPWCIEHRLRAFEKHPENDFLVFPMQFFKKKPGDTSRLWNDLDKPQEDIDRFLNFDTPWQTTCPIWKKSAFDKMGGGWKEEIKAKQDVEFHVRALAFDLKYKTFSEKHDCYYRSLKGSSISRDVLVNNEKVESWKRVIYLNAISLKDNNKLNYNRKSYLANNLIRLALDVYGLNKTFYNPGFFLKPIKSFALLSGYKYLKTSFLLKTLFLLEKLRLRKIGVYIYGRQQKWSV